MLIAPHCPVCAARLDLPDGAERVRCAYCSAHLFVNREKVSGHVDAPASTAPAHDFVPPDPSLFTLQHGRWEMAYLEQSVGQGIGEGLAGHALGEGRFALIWLRLVDRDGKPMPGDLAGPLEAFARSMKQDADLGLGARDALEAVARAQLAERLEVAAVLFEPARMTATPYLAGCPDALWWLSGDEGRALHPTAAREPLEKKHLRQGGEVFATSEPLHLEADDAIVIVSAGCTGRGARHTAGGHAVMETLNAHLVEAPQRLLTLTKNAIWAERAQSSTTRKEPPVGDVVLAAVRALPPGPDLAVAPAPRQSLQTRRFDLTLSAKPQDRVVLGPLSFEERSLLVWLSPIGDAAPSVLDAGVAKLFELLGQANSGHAEDPRGAGRLAYEAMGLTPDQLRMCVVLLKDKHERVYYFRSGFKQPVALDERQRNAVGLQAFDEGGEATVQKGGRLLFTGQLDYADEPTTPQDLAARWPGGRASRLFSVLKHHWRWKSSESLFQQAWEAAARDAEGATPHGLLVVTGKG
jgi:LSD1 subclass zinc finger protein